MGFTEKKVFFNFKSESYLQAAAVWTPSAVNIKDRLLETKFIFALECIKNVSVMFLFMRKLTFEKKVTSAYILNNMFLFVFEHPNLSNY